MSKILLFLVLLLGVVIIGLSGVLFLYPPKTEPVITPVVLDYKNITYVIEKQSITLVNGYAEMLATPGSASKIITKYFGNDTTGDLNGDGLQDVIFLLTQETGGSGIFFYLAGALKTETGYQPTNTVFLGDRIAPQQNRVNSGNITVNYVDRKPSDAMSTAPSVGVSRYFTVQNNLLVEKIDAGVFAASTTFTINQKMKFNDGLVVALKEINDSRCQPPATCVWAGELSTLFHITGADVGDANQEVRLGTVTAKKVTKNGYKFELKEITSSTATIIVTKESKLDNN